MKHISKSIASTTDGKGGGRVHFGPPISLNCVEGNESTYSDVISDQASDDARAELNYLDRADAAERDIKATVRYHNIQAKAPRTR